MGASNQDFTITRGDELTITFPVTQGGSALNLTGGYAEWALAKDANTPPKVFKSTQTAGSGLTLSGTPTDGIVTLVIAEDDLKELEAGSWQHALKVFATGSLVPHTASKGTVTLEEGIIDP